MDLGVEQALLALVGALFLCAPMLANRLRFECSLATRIVCALVASSFGFAAYGLASDYPARYERVAMLLCGLLPVLLLALLTTEQFGSAVRLRRPRSAVAEGSSHLLAHASDPGAPGELLARLAFARPDLRVTIAKNPATPSSVLQWLSGLGSLEITVAIAERNRAAMKAVDDAYTLAA